MSLDPLVRNMVCAWWSGRAAAELLQALSRAPAQEPNYGAGSHVVMSGAFEMDGERHDVQLRAASLDVGRAGATPTGAQRNARRVRVRGHPSRPLTSAHVSRVRSDLAR